MAKRALNRRIGVLILAAGKGTRMESEQAKVLHTVAGHPMLQYVLKTAQKLQPIKITVVIGHQGKEVEALFSNWKGVSFAWQKEMRGTGDAVKSAQSAFFSFEGPILILYGDTPGIRIETLRRLAMVHSASQNALTLLTSELEDPTGYGRILIDSEGLVSGIVEEKDASEKEKEITEINTGIGIWESKFLFSALKLLKPTNQQKEYYLTDLVAMARKAGKSVGRLRIRDFQEVLGINSRENLAEVSRIFYEEKALSLLKSGVTFEDPASNAIEPEVEIGKDSVVEPVVQIRGKSKLGTKIKIGASAKIENSELGDQVDIGNNSVVQNAKIGDSTKIASNTTVG